jgi:GNAT superfamily N-acetyltransferase
MSDYGNTELHQIESVENFWALYDELIDDDSGFQYNRATLLEAFKNGNLWGLTIKETDSMFKRGAAEDIIFIKPCVAHQLYLLPCLCVLNNEGNKILIIWTHSRARRHGYAKTLIEYLSFDTLLIPDRPLPESIPFWKACGYEL